MSGSLAASLSTPAATRRLRHLATIPDGAGPRRWFALGASNEAEREAFPLNIVALVPAACRRHGLDSQIADRWRPASGGRLRRPSAVVTGRSTISHLEKWRRGEQDRARRARDESGALAWVH